MPVFVFVFFPVVINVIYTYIHVKSPRFSLRRFLHGSGSPLVFSTSSLGPLRCICCAASILKPWGSLMMQVISSRATVSSATRCCKLGWVAATQIFLYFHPEPWGRWTHFWCSYFSNGLVQPPTSWFFFRSFFSPKLKLRMGEEKWYSNGAIGKFISLGHTAKTSLKSFHHRARRACSGRMPSVPWKSIEKPKVQHWRCIAVKDKRQRIQQAMSTANSAFTKWLSKCGIDIDIFWHKDGDIFLKVSCSLVG